MKIVSVGCGKMGLPLAAHIASRGHDVVGVDVDASTVDKINAGTCPFEEPGVPELVSKAVSDGKLSAVTRVADAAEQADAYIVIVPVLLTQDRRAELSIITSVARDIAAVLKPGQTVSFETTLPVGTTRKVLTPILEESGLTAERDFFVIFSPERVKSMKVLAHLTKTPKVVGGHGERSLARGVEIYDTCLEAEVTPVPTLEHAEMIKLAGMIYRDVNIALANELAQYCEALGLDAPTIVREANTDNESALLLPGIGVGGHCTPAYPYFMLHDPAAGPQRLARAAREINDGQAEHSAARLQEALGGLDGKRIVVLGLAFRPDIKEDTCSSAYLVRDALVRLGAQVELHDPLFSDAEISAKGFVPWTGKWKDTAAAVLVTAHAAFRDLDYRAMAAAGVQTLLDGRNACCPEAVREAGLEYFGIGIN